MLRFISLKKISFYKISEAHVSVIEEDIKSMLCGNSSENMFKPNLHSACFCLFSANCFILPPIARYSAHNRLIKLLWLQDL